MEKIKITRAQETVSIRNEDEDFRQEITETQPAFRKKPKRMMEEICRGYNFQTFKMHDGSYRSKIYCEPINYYDKSEKRFVRYDNRLFKTKRIDGEMSFSGYENTAGDFSVRFAENISDGVIYTIKRDDYAVSLKPYGSAQGETEIINAGNAEKVKIARYCQGVDLEYCLSAGKIKETIIVQNNISDNKFKFILQTSNLKMEIGENGHALDFIDEVSGKTVFKIPAPSMVDANGATSDDVYYDITARSKNEYEFQVVASADWMNAQERLYPVYIDPTIINYNEHYIETYRLREYAYSLSKNSDSVNVQYLGNNRYNSKIWLRFELDEIIPESAVIRSAVMHMYKMAFYPDGTKKSDIALKQISNDQAQEGSFVGKLCETGYTDIIGTTIRESYEEFTVDVTNSVRDSDKRSKGLLFNVVDSEADGLNFYIFSAFTGDLTHKAYLDVDYYVPEEFSGGEKYSASVNDSCGYTLNLYTGSELIKYQDVSMSGNRLPLQISHIYNSLYKTKNTFVNGIGTGLPNGWKLNIQQYLYSEGEGDEQKYVYIDQAGFKHNLTRHLKVEATPSGTSYTFNTDNYEFRDDSIGMKYIGSNQLMDNSGNVYTFTAKRLTKITDKNGNTMQFTYGTDNECNYNLICVTDGCGRKANLQYESGFLKRINLPDGTTITQENLATSYIDEISSSDGTSVKFEYSARDITRITDITGYQLNIVRNGNHYVFRDGTSVNTISGTGIEALCDINEGDDVNTENNVWRYDGYAVVEYENGIKTYYKFDSDGVCVNKFSLSSDSTPRILDYGGTRNDENVSYQISSIPGAKNKLTTNWTCPANGIIGTSCQLMGKAGAQTYMQQTVSRSTLGELRGDEGYAVVAFVRTDEYCLNPTEKGEAKFELSVALTYSDTSKNTERVYLFDGRIKNEYQLGIIPLAKADIDGLSSLTVKVDYSKCYNGGKDNLSAMYGSHQSVLNIRKIELVRCNLTRTVTAPAFFNGSSCFSARDISRVYYGSEYYTVNADAPDTMLTFANDIANMLANPGKIYKNGQAIESNVDLATIKLNAVISTTKKYQSFSNNLFSLDYAPRGYAESESVNGTSRIWSDAQGLVRRSVFINPKDESFHVFYSYDSNGNVVKVEDEKLGDKKEYAYNSHGTVIKETVGNSNTGDKLIYENATDTGGYYTVKEYDERYSIVDDSDNCVPVYTQNAYDSYKGRLSKATLPNGQAFNYGYGSHGMLNSFSAGFATRNGNSLTHIQNENTQYEYNAGLLTKINRTGAVYEFEYDGYSRVKRVKLNGATIYTAAYNKSGDGNSHTTVTYGNGWSGEEISDDLDRFIEKSVTKNGSKQVIASAAYDSETMRLKTLTDSACGSGKVTMLSYAYDEHGGVVSVSYSGYRTGKFSQETDNEGYVTKTVYQKGIGETQEYSYLYEKYGNTTGNRIPNAPLTKLYLPTGKRIKYRYDSLNRLQEKGIVTDTSEYYSELYTYEEGGYHEESVTGVFCGPSATTIKPDRETTFVSEVEFRGFGITDKYEYDLHGNISKRVTGGKEIRYTYDDIDRLVREDNAALNKTYFYEYDDFGNIEKITAYNYTTGNSLTGGITKSYAYDSSKRLITVTENGVTQSISGYDALGNPSSYKGNTLTWTRGRMLAGCGNNSYLYDMDGVRQEKTVNGVVHTYYTDGTKIIAEKVGDKIFEYYYDAQGIVAFKYEGNVYYFKKNLMGDIDRIYDANKNLVAEYKYDAWGNHRIYTGTGIDITDNSSYNNSVAKLNPFRYRGYYYDTETGLYYLNSRYYDPSIGRFINADDISYIQPTEVNGLNLYAYCFNNPVMYTDPEGTWSWDTFWKGVMLALTAVAAIAVSVVTFGAGTPLAMTIVAGVTLTAGVLTGVNGVATLVEAGTGYNFVCDGVFQGNESAYNWYEGIMEGLAIVGTTILGIYSATGRAQASRIGRKFLGKGYKLEGTNRWVSADGMRQMRLDNHKPFGWHFNLESFSHNYWQGGRNKIVSNIHQWFKWFITWVK